MTERDDDRRIGGMETGGLVARLEEMFAPTLDAMGYELVRVQLQGKQRPTLQIMADRRDERPMMVDDCADISRTLSALLDVEDPISGAYTLEVSSPGIDRPLVRRRDFERFAGFEAKVETLQPVDGRKRFRGRLLGVDDSAVRMALEDGAEVRFRLAEIGKARLVLTDELIAAAQRRESQES